MGNCVKPVDPLFATIPRTTIEIDVSPIRESNLPIIFLIGGPGAGKSLLKLLSVFIYTVLRHNCTIMKLTYLLASLTIAH